MKFIDLNTQYDRLSASLDTAVLDVLRSGQFVLGPAVKELEEKLAAFAGAGEAISCANGTDALHLVLRSWDVGPGDAVFVPAFTFAASGEAPILAGATPFFVDVREADFNLDPARLTEALSDARAQGFTPKAVIAVDLFGLPADYDALSEICDAEGLKLLSDCAQSYGASYKGRKIGALGDAAATSFYPAKPLGCYGDGGCVFTGDAEVADRIRSLRNHGAGADRYDQVRIGFNSRLDSIQAAVLLEKLKIFEEEIAARNAIARRYNEALHDIAAVPEVPEGLTSVWAQYTLRAPGRDSIMSALKERGVPSVIYYPRPLNRQPAFDGVPTARAGTPVADRLAAEVFSLPMHPYLSAEDQGRVIDAVRTALAEAA